MQPFYKLLGITLLSATTNNIIWFALVYWAYLETHSVIATSTLGGFFTVIATVSSVWFGSLVDHNKKKNVMLASSLASLGFFSLGFSLYNAFPESIFTSITSPSLWIFAVILLLGTLAGSIYQIAVPTLVGLIVPEDNRDRANGMFGTTMGIAFGITSVASGIILGTYGMSAILILGIIGSLLASTLMFLLPLPEPQSASKDQNGEKIDKKMDIKGTIQIIKGVPGLFPLIFFTMFNNFVGGVFMALMDAYGLTLVSVQVWGFIWGALSFGFILGGLYVAKNGVGKNPLKNLFRINLFLWTVCIIMTIQPSIVLLSVCIFLWMPMMPFVEAIEQTILQKVVPPERLGRVIGFAHSLEGSASPLTSFIIGPVTQAIFIPFMTTGAGVPLIGNWFGVGEGRGIALVFIMAGILGLIVTSIAMRSNSYKVLAKRYRE